MHHLQPDDHDISMRRVLALQETIYESSPEAFKTPSSGQSVASDLSSFASFTMLKSTLGRRLLSLALASVALVRAQYGPYGEDDGSYPHSYPGIPTGDFSPEWQSCTCFRFLLEIQL